MYQHHVRHSFDRDDGLTEKRSWNYRVRIRGTMYLWGSAGIADNASFNSPLMLHVGNDVLGEVVTIGTETANGVRTTLGTLQPGERYSIAIQKVRGVFASCALQSVMSCLIKGS